MTNQPDRKASDQDTTTVTTELAGEAAGTDQRTGLVRLSVEDCVAMLSSSTIGRIVFVDGEQPLALPVNYAWFEGSVVFRTGEGQKLHAATVGQTVAFEVDSIDEAAHTGWSVILKGTAREVSDWAEQEQLEQLAVRPWQRQPWRRGWVRIDPIEVTGRKLDL